MMTKVLRKMKKTVSLMLAAIMVMGAVIMVPAEAEAAELDVTKVDGVRYVKYDKTDLTLGQAPEYSGVNDGYGFLFGGWFVIRDNKYVPLQVQADVFDTDAYVYAKFVPANVLSIKCQNFAGTEEGARTNIRVISSVDTLNYTKIGFDLYSMKKNTDGTYKISTMGKDGTQYTRKTYDEFRVFGSTGATDYTSFTPEEVFGEGAKYFTSWQINNIGPSNHGTIVGIRPYWITMDGVKVYGLSKYAHVEDGYRNYINIPINLHSATDVAAGRLNVKYDTESFILVGTECGRVFPEMTSIDDNGTIKCVGNVSDVSKNATSDNIYMNIRLELKDTAGFASGLTAYDFDMTNESFTNIDETLFDAAEYPVWKVKTGVIKK